MIQIRGINGFELQLDRLRSNMSCIPTRYILISKGKKCNFSMRPTPT